MKLNIFNPKQALNKAYLKEKVSRENIELFKKNLSKLIGKIDEQESEEHLKNVISEFLKDTWYKETNEINTKDRKDLVIHTGKTTKEPVGVILEVKKPSNRSEMMTEAKPNVKALHELILYYLRERVEHNNIDIKYLVVTNIYEWFIIDEVWFEKNVYRNTKLKKDFENWKLSGNDTKFFYDSIAKPFMESVTEKLDCTYFDLRAFEKVITNDDKKDDNKLIALYKLLSPVHLLKQPFANDSNSLDTKFYSELLHIIGLEEVKDGGKKLIKRKEKPDPASILENTIMKLEDKDSLRGISNLLTFGDNKKDQLFNVALELSITWINRVLFLKLLEAQLYKYHKGNDEYVFLNHKTIHDFDELSNLFFQVLAERQKNRREHLKEKFKRVPYLNSSLFERTELERQTFDISGLDNRLELKLISTTVLKNESGKKKSGELTTLQYLFDFLDSFDFTSEGTEEIQEQNKNLINASVLGLIFEKINGYKDGSFFTPGFVTMYMCKETIRRSVIQKFNERYKIDCETFDDLKNYISGRFKAKDILEFNAVINDLKICDPAVGSGHFLVSALNEVIAIKAELGILADKDGLRLTGYEVKIENDELIVTYNDDTEIFEYSVTSNSIAKEIQRVQKTLFHEKESIIENSLFGVDINPNSVKICRLRLWIELLKNAYYTEESKFTELETLPNIDINIKCGNSLISRFTLDSDLKKALKGKWNIDTYKIAVHSYHEAENKEEKRKLEELIDTIKKDFRTEIGGNDPRKKRLAKLKEDLFLKTKSPKLEFDIEMKRGGVKLEKERIKKITDEISKIEQELKDIESSKIYTNAFEWRFEFPEVLDNDGKFIGFDVIIGNPPYGVDFNDLERSYMKNKYPVSSQGKIDSYKLFFERSFQILRQGGFHSFIAPNTFLYNLQSRGLREFLIENTILAIAIELRKNIFEDAPDVVTVINVSRFVIPTDESKTRVKVAFPDHKYTDLNKDPWAIDQIIPIDVFRTDSEKKLNLRRDFKLDGIIQKINIHKQLGNYFTLKQGTKPYGDKENKEEELIAKDKKGKDWERAINGRNIAQHKITFENDFVKRSDKIHSCLPKEIVNGEKIYFQRMRKISLFPRVVACYDNNNLHGLYTCSVIYKEDKNELSLKYLSALLNSHLINVWYKNFDTDIEIKLASVKCIPIPFLNLKEQQPFIDAVEKIMLKKSEGKDCSDLVNKLNKMIYAIYGLTAEEINIIESN